MIYFAVGNILPSAYRMLNLSFYTPISQNSMSIALQLVFLVMLLAYKKSKTATD